MEIGKYLNMKYPVVGYENLSCVIEGNWKAWDGLYCAAHRVYLENEMQICRCYNNGYVTQAQCYSLLVSNMNLYMSVLTEIGE